MNMLLSVFATNMRKYRKAANLSQEKLAELAGLHRTYIGGIEQKRVNVSLKNVEKIANALDIDPALLFLSDSPDKSRHHGKGEAITSRIDEIGSGDYFSRPQGNDKGHARDYAIISWRDEKISIRPIEIIYEDLSLQILSMLIREGLDGEELLDNYAQVHDKVLDIIRTEFNR